MPVNFPCGIEAPVGTNRCPKHGSRENCEATLKKNADEREATPPPNKPGEPPAGASSTPEGDHPLGEGEKQDVVNENPVETPNTTGEEHSPRPGKTRSKK